MGTRRSKGNEVIVLPNHPPNPPRPKPSCPPLYSPACALPVKCPHDRSSIPIEHSRAITARPPASPLIHPPCPLLSDNTSLRVVPIMYRCKAGQWIALNTDERPHYYDPH